MRKTTFHICLSILLALINISILYAQQTENVWNFPIRPGTEEWGQLDSYEAKLDAYNIPPDILNSISTKALTESCLSYPEWRLIFTRNSYCAGLAYVGSIFNGFGELLDRTEAADILLAKYKSTDPTNIDKNWSPAERGRYTFNITYIELLLSHNQFIKNLSRDQEIELITLAVEKYHSKKSLPENYSLYGTSPTALICARIIDKNGFIKDLDSEKFNFFTHTGMINDSDFLDQIVDQAEKFLNN